MFSNRYGWCVYGVDSDGKPDGVATAVEAEAVDLFWRLADTWDRGTVTIYAEGRALWLDPNTTAVRLVRVDLGKAHG